MGTQWPVVSSKKLIRALEKKGFVPIRQKGSHIRFKMEASDETMLVTVPCNCKEVRLGTLLGVMNQARMTKGEFLQLL